MRAVFLSALLAATALSLSGCAWSQDPGIGLGGANTLEVYSDAFVDEGPIPVDYTCDGEDVSPPLDVTNVPTAASLAIVFDDPDAADFVHWLVWNLPGRSGNLSAGEDVASRGATVGANDFGGTGYAGPCPPSGAEHRYRLRVFALDRFLDLSPGADAAAFEAAARGRVVAWGQLAGTYARTG